jgi:hypothetical protein
MFNVLGKMKKMGTTRQQSPTSCHGFEVMPSHEVGRKPNLLRTRAKYVWRGSLMAWDAGSFNLKNSIP